MTCDYCEEEAAIVAHVLGRRTVMCSFHYLDFVTDRASFKSLPAGLLDLKVARRDLGLVPLDDDVLVDMIDERRGSFVDMERWRL